jgi:hypothetical protein
MTVASARCGDGHVRDRRHRELDKISGRAQQVATMIGVLAAVRTGLERIGPGHPGLDAGTRGAAPGGERCPAATWPVHGMPSSNI